MRANSNGVKRDNHAFAGSLYTLRHLETDVSRLRGPTCAIVPREDEKLCKAIPNCCVAMGLGEEGSLCLRHGGSWTFVRGGARRTSLHPTPFCPRRAAKDHEGPRRRSRATAGKATAEGQRQLRLLFCPRRTRRATEGHGEGQGQLQERRLQKDKGNFYFFCSRRAAKKVKGNCRKGNCRRSRATSISFVHGGHEGPRRRSRATAGKATAEGQRQLQLLLSTEGAENTLCSAGSLGAFGYWWAVVRRGQGPMCACVPPVDEEIFLVIPSCCVAMGWRNRDLLV